MTITAAELGQARADAESRMASRVTVRRVTSGAVQDEDTGLMSSNWGDVHVNLPLRLKSGATATGTGATRTTVGGVEVELQMATAYVPTSTDDLEDGDLIEVTAGEWSGTVWRVIEARKGDQQTARRIPVIETARPSEWDS